MRPRKPFSMQKKGSFTAVPTYKRSFKLQPSKNKGNYNLGILLLLIFLFVVGFSIPNWLEHARINDKEEIALRVEKNNMMFNFLMTSGKERLVNGNVSGAYSEFKLATELKPNDKELNILLYETLSILCFDYNEHCDDLD